jgi:signal transduction histidine kinase
MKKWLAAALLLFYMVLPFRGFAYTSADTNQVNAWNDLALDLAYSDPHQGLVYVQKSIALSRESSFSKGEIKALIRRGIIYDVLSKSGKAVDAYEEALALSRKTHYQKGEGSSLNNLGLIYMNQHDLSKAMYFFQQATEIFTKLKDYQLLGNITNNMGIIYQETNRTQLALAYFRQSIRYYEQIGADAVSNDVYSNIALIYQEGTKQLDSSAYFLRKAIAGQQQANDLYGLGISYNNMGLLLTSQHKYDEAIENYKQSIVLAKKIGNIPMRVSSGYNLSQVYNRQGNWRAQIGILNEIYPLMKKENLTELGFKICHELSRWHYLHGSPDKGQEFSNEYIRYHSIYYNQEATKNLTEIEKRYEVEKKRQENRLLKKDLQLTSLKIRENQQQATIQNLLWAILLFVIILGAILTFLWLRKKGLQKELEGQKAVFEATNSERRRISFDLHDHVGSQLSFVVSNLEMLTQASQHTDSAFAARIERTFKMSQEAIDSLRDTVWALHTTDITFEMLSLKMEQFLQKLAGQDEKIQLHCESQPADNKVLSPQVTMHLFRIYQEAVHNVLKHAQCSDLQVRFTEFPGGEIQLCIGDNGIGIGRKTTSPEGHYGLQNMYERAAKIGAECRIQNQESGGTRVEIRIP